MDVKKVKPATPEWHFNWSRQIQTNRALAFSKSPNQTSNLVLDNQHS